MATLAQNLRDLMDSVELREKELAEAKRQNERLQDELLETKRVLEYWKEQSMSNLIVVEYWKKQAKENRIVKSEKEIQQITDWKKYSTETRSVLDRKKDITDLTKDIAERKSERVEHHQVKDDTVGPIEATRLTSKKESRIDRIEAMRLDPEKGVEDDSDHIEAMRLDSNEKQTTMKDVHTEPRKYEELKPSASEIEENSVSVTKEPKAANPFAIDQLENVLEGNETRGAPMEPDTVDCIAIELEGNVVDVKVSAPMDPEPVALLAGQEEETVVEVKKRRSAPLDPEAINLLTSEQIRKCVDVKQLRKVPLDPEPVDPIANKLEGDAASVNNDNRISDSVESIEDEKDDTRSFKENKVTGPVAQEECANEKKRMTSSERNDFFMEIRSLTEWSKKFNEKAKKIEPLREIGTLSNISEGVIKPPIDADVVELSHLKAKPEEELIKSRNDPDASEVAPQSTANPNAKSATVEIIEDLDVIEVAPNFTENQYDQAGADDIIEDLTTNAKGEKHEGNSHENESHSGSDESSFLSQSSRESSFTYETRTTYETRSNLLVKICSSDSSYESYGDSKYSSSACSSGRSLKANSAFSNSAYTSAYTYNDKSTILSTGDRQVNHDALRLPNCSTDCTEYSTSSDIFEGIETTMSTTLPDKACVDELRHSIDELLRLPTTLPGVLKMIDIILNTEQYYRTLWLDATCEHTKRQGDWTIIRLKTLKQEGHPSLRWHEKEWAPKTKECLKVFVPILLELYEEYQDICKEEVDDRGFDRYAMLQG